jgi:hypothetical protein
MIQNIGQFQQACEKHLQSSMLTSRSRCCDLFAFPANAANYIHSNLQYRRRPHGRQYHLQHAKREAGSQDSIESVDYPERVGLLGLACSRRQLPH